MKNGVGELRQSKLVTTFGPGAVLDLRGPSGAPISGLLAGLEEWDACAQAGQAGLDHPQVIRERRLQKRLHVKGFRLPPVKPEYLQRKESAVQGTADVLPVVRFPEWLLCPRCNRLKSATNWAGDDGKPERRCNGHDGEKVYVVPVRFIIACEDGHIDEFPWLRWCGCNCGKIDLRLDTVGPGLAGKVVRCASCDASASLEGCFGREALKRVGLDGCAGRTPWLGSDRKEAGCVRQARALQRGASNVYYGCIESSLDIPPFSADLSPIFGRHWPFLQDVDPEDWPDLIRIHKLEKLTHHPKDVLLRILHEWKAADDADDPNKPLELAEYVKFREAGLNKINVGEFQTTPGEVPAELGETLSSVVQATRLREVRAQTGFTRIHPPGGDFGQPAQKKGSLYRQRKDWLPAVELRGEGVFLRLHEEALARWETSEQVRKRVERFRAPLGVMRALAGQQAEGELAPSAFAARFVLLHSLAHALIRRLSLDCGYSSSALRERLYVGVDSQPMSGLLIHTGAPDSEGTLGGLVRQGTPDRMWGTFKGALKEMSWCSSDPVCITGTATLSSPENGAACHACLLVPETSCQHFNRFLDRALLVGTPDKPDLGFFHDVLEQSVL
jgi:hypothetical protein